MTGVVVLVVEVALCGNTGGFCKLTLLLLLLLVLVVVVVTATAGAEAEDTDATVRRMREPVSAGFGVTAAAVTDFFAALPSVS